MIPIGTWEDLTAEVTRLYNEKKHAEADALVVARGGWFPGKEAWVFYLRMCLTAVMGKPDEALSQFEQSVQEGYWYSDGTLRTDPDLKSLYGLPEFERLAAICRERQAAAEVGIKPYMAVAEPEGGQPPYPTLIALHGNNRDADGSMRFWRTACQQGFLVAMPQSTQVGNMDGFVWNDAERAQRDILSQFDALKQQHPVDASRVVVGGFSMGGRVACWQALSGALPSAGFIGAAPFLGGFEAWEPQIKTAAARGLRGYLLVGDWDEACYKDTVAMHKMLEAHGVACFLRVYPELRHVYPGDFDVTLREALDFILNG